MNDYKSNTSLRAFFMFAASTIWLGIILTGFGESSWILYLPSITFTFAAVTGYCPSLIGFRKLLNQ